MRKEKELIKNIKRDKKYFEEVYSKYYQKVLNYIRSRINNKSDAEDLTSEIFEKAFRAINDFKWQGVSISAWIFRIARNLLTDYYRKRARTKDNISLSEVENVIFDSDLNLYLEYVKDEEERILYDSMREFGEDDQYLIYYKFFEGLSNKEIAKITGLSESNIGTKLYRIRKKILKILKQKGF